jgi:hypothetical protein
MKESDPKILRGRDRIVVGFTTTCAISAYHHKSCEFEPRSWRGVLDNTCDKNFQWLAAGRRFSPGTPVSSTNKTDHHDIAEILLKVALNTVNHHHLNVCDDSRCTVNLLNITFDNTDMVYSHNRTFSCVRGSEPFSSYISSYN